MTTTSGSVPASRSRRATPLSPAAIRAAGFTKTALTRRGYDIDEVDTFLARVADEVATADADKANMRAEIERLRNWYRDQGVNVDTGANGAAAPTTAAVNVMSRAQQAADTHVAQAEDYARRLVAQARQQYEEMLEEAQRQAAEAAEAAANAYRATETVTGPGSAEREQLERRIAYLRTFAEVTQVQLRSALDSLGREVDKLGQLPVQQQQII